MDYDHSRKAGNRGDVWKHSVLVALADAMPSSTKSFRYVECHAGAPIHELVENGEWKHGVGRILSNAPRDDPYMAMASQWLERKQYPASWVFVAKRLAKRFAHVEIRLFDYAAHVAEQYPPPPEVAVPTNIYWDFRQADGYDAAAGLDTADLVFLDPPYRDADGDWQRLGQACKTLLSRGIPFAAWYPISWPTRPQRLSDTTRCETWECIWGRFGSKPSQDLKGCGMLVSDRLAVDLSQIEDRVNAVAACINSTVSTRRPQEV